MGLSNIIPSLIDAVRSHESQIKELQQRRLPATSSTDQASSGLIGRSSPLNYINWTTPGPGITSPLYWDPSTFAGINAAQDLIICPGAGPGGHTAPHVGPAGIYAFSLEVGVAQGTNGGTGGVEFRLAVDLTGANPRARFTTISFNEHAYFADDIRKDLSLTCWLPAGALIEATAIHDAAAGASTGMGGVVAYLGGG